MSLKPAHGMRGPTGINVNNIIASLYETKLQEDQRMDREMKDRLSLPLFLKKFLLRTYGLKDIATKQMMALLSSVRIHRKSNERQNLFARLVGLEEEDALSYSPMACDYFMLALSELYSSIRIRCR